MMAAKKTPTAATPRGALRPVGIVFMDEAGNIVLRPATIERVNRGGRPKNTLRDVALTLHFEYLHGVEKKETRIFPSGRNVRD